MNVLDWIREWLVAPSVRENQRLGANVSQAIYVELDRVRDVTTRKVNIGGVAGEILVPKHYEDVSREFEKVREEYRGEIGRLRKLVRDIERLHDQQIEALQAASKNSKAPRKAKR